MDSSRDLEILPATRHHGLASLPNEILVVIFEKSVDLNKHRYRSPCETVHHVIHTLSSVSKRFREIVLACSELWTYLDLDSCGPESFDLPLSRCRNRPMKVHCRCSVQTLGSSSFRAALEISDRWGHLYADLREAEDASLLPSLSLAAVKSFEVLGKFRSPDSFPWMSPGWIFPNVEHVRLFNSIPNPSRFDTRH